MINLVIGDRGSGKTCFITCMGFLHYLAGYTIYANYKLFNVEYHNLNNLSEFNQINTQNNIFLLDELYMDSDCRLSGSFSTKFLSEKVMQSRKFGGGGKNVIFIANPFADLNDKRIRGLANYIYEPEILKADENEKPLVLKLEYFKVGDTKRKKIKSFVLPTQFNGYDVPELYDTYQELDGMSNDIVMNDRQKIIDNYWDSPIEKKSSLGSVIRIDEMRKGNLLSASDANLLADYIITMRSQNDKDN
jgi:hypothetical protein